MLHIRICLTVIVFALTSSTSQSALLFDWTSISSGSAGGITATISSTVSGGDFYLVDVEADEPTFVATFAATVPTLFYEAPGPGVGEIDSSFSFSSALPTGSRLLALDLDGILDQFTLTSGNVPLTLIEQAESTLEGPSNFPVYNAATGVLAGQGGHNNTREAAIFDVSGLTNLQIDFIGQGVGAYIAIAVPVPEPSSIFLAAIGIFALVLYGWRHRKPARR